MRCASQVPAAPVPLIGAAMRGVFVATNLGKDRPLQLRSEKLADVLSRLTAAQVKEGDLKEQAVATLSGRATALLNLVHRGAVAQ